MPKGYWRQHAAMVMGVVNVTPDSFSGDGIHLDPESAADHGKRLAEQGAAYLDVGGESTRPGYTPVSPEEQIARVLPVLRLLAGRTSSSISIDTTHARVAACALTEGAEIVNDVSGLGDPDMLEVVSESGAGLVLVHRGKPPPGASAAAGVAEALQGLVWRAQGAGIPVEHMAIDPGFGIGGKTWRDNFAIMRDLAALRAVGVPILVGPSRKGMIGKVLGVEPGDRLEGSLALAALCVASGAKIVRAHDVRETVQVVRMLDAIAEAVEG